VVNAQGMLDPDIHRGSGLVKNPLTPAQLTEWRETIEQLARDFIAGRADVNPSDYPATCELCGLYTLCRVREREDQHEPEEDEAEVLDE
jgi:ATP-dependent helicase/nuclease subunit B